MLLVPFEVPHEYTRQTGRGPVIVVMILEPENLERMKKADSLDFQFRSLFGRVNISKPIATLDIIIAYDEETNKILEFQEKKDLAGLINWLERGRQILPGDVQPLVVVRKT